MTTRELKKRVSEWASIIGLADWKIDAEFVTDTQTKDTMAEVSWQPEWKEAEILFRREAQLKKTGRSIDHFIVHELLHIVLEGHKTVIEEYDPLYEAAINNIASLIIAKKL